jgi:Na+-transporting NADH:ubiquinone oxidoreductase subunit NqrE
MKWLKYVLAIAIGASAVAIVTMYPDKTFPAFVVAWLILIPIVSVIYLIYGLREYIKERKNSIVVSIKHNNTTERLMELIRKEEEIKDAKEALYKEMKKNKRRGEI